MSRSTAAVATTPEVGLNADSLSCACLRRCREAIVDADPPPSARAALLRPPPAFLASASASASASSSPTLSARTLTSAVHMRALRAARTCWKGIISIASNIIYNTRNKIGNQIANDPVIIERKYFVCAYHEECLGGDDPSAAPRVQRGRRRGGARGEQGGEAAQRGPERLEKRSPIKKRTRDVGGSFAQRHATAAKKNESSKE